MKILFISSQLKFDKNKIASINKNNVMRDKALRSVYHESEKYFVVSIVQKVC